MEGGRREQSSVGKLMSHLLSTVGSVSLDSKVTSLMAEFYYTMFPACLWLMVSDSPALRLNVLFCICCSLS